MLTMYSAKAVERVKGENLGSVKEEFRLGTGCEIFRFTNSPVNSESNGIG
jgi:hypothetical protein